MHQVYSMTRGGRPRLAIVVSALLLLLATGMASYVIRHRHAETGTIQLLPAESYGKLGLRLRLPMGWKVGDPERTTNGHVLIALENTEDTSRQLVVFRVRSLLLTGAPLAQTNTVSQAARLNALSEAMRAATPDGRIRALEQVATGKIGSLPSDVYQFVIGSQEGLWGLANVAVGPDQQVTGVVLLANGRTSAHDQMLLDEVSQSVLIEETQAKPPAPKHPGKKQNSPGDSDEDSGKPLARNSRNHASARSG